MAARTPTEVQHSTRHPHPSIVETFVNLKGGVPINDRLDVFQKGIEAMATAGQDDRKRFQESFISLLHDKNQSGISLGQGRFGNSGHPYVRKVTSTGADTQLPSVNDVAQLLCGSRTKHINGISGLAYAIANIIYLSISRTSRQFSSYNETSAYFDLSPLYGVNKDEEKSVRAPEGYGTLAPDCFFEDRVEYLSPAVSVILILLNRNHNYIAYRIRANEGAEAIDPAETDKISAEDDRVFGIARSINCIHFKNIIVEDFLKVLMGLQHVGPGPNIDIIGDVGNGGRGTGINYKASSVEFTLLYHCPALMGTADEEWLGQQPEGAITQAARDQRAAVRTSFTFQSKGRVLERGDDSRFPDDGLAEILLTASDSEAGMPGGGNTPSVLQDFTKTIMEQARTWNVCTLNQFRSYLGLKPFTTFEQWNSNLDVARAAQKIYVDIDKLELYPGLQAETVMLNSGLCLGYTQTFALLMDIVTSIRSDPRFTVDFTAEKLTEWGLRACAREPDNGAFGAALPSLILRNLPRNYPFNNAYALFPLTVPVTTKEKLKDKKLLHDYDCEKPHKPVVHILSTQTAIGTMLNDAKTYATPYGKDLKLLTKGYGYMLGFDDEELHDAEQYMTLYALMPDTRSFQMYARHFSETAIKLIKQNWESRDTDIAMNGQKAKKIDIIQDVIIPVCTRWVCQTICDLPIESHDTDKLKAHFQDFAALYAFVFHKFDVVDGWIARKRAVDASKKLNALIEENLKKAICRPTEPATTDYVVRLSKEFTVGHELGTPLAYTFLERLVETNDTVGKFKYLAREGKFGNLTTMEGSTNATNDPKVYEEALGKLKMDRLAAHVLGLCVVLSVNYAQACSQAVDFYLDEKYKSERDTIIELAQSRMPTKDQPVKDYIDELRQHTEQPFGPFPKENTQDPGVAQNSQSHGRPEPEIPHRLRDFLIMGYVREAQRIGQPFGLIRLVEEDLSTESQTSLGVQAKKGDRIFADLGEMHRNDVPESQVIHPGRITPSIQGMGLHKCPGLSLCENTMPELFKVFFNLKNLRRIEGNQGILRTFNYQPENWDPRIFLNAKGETTAYPESLVLLYDELTFPEWVQPQLDHPPPKIIMDRIIILLVLLTAAWQLISTFIGMMPTSMPELPKTMAINKIVCNQPTTVFQRWDINTIVAGPDGQPSPIEYTVERKKPHRLTVLDIDARDMRLAVYVDGIMRGMSSDFKLDKSVLCGDAIQNCLNQNFSTAAIVVPPGRHTVKIVWAGKEFHEGTQYINWGNDYSRRLMWQLEQCS